MRSNLIETVIVDGVDTTTYTDKNIIAPFRSVVAVSYTHLDVYKRQGPDGRRYAHHPA